MELFIGCIAPVFSFKTSFRARSRALRGTNAQKKNMVHIYRTTRPFRNTQTIVLVGLAYGNGSIADNAPFASAV